MFDDQALRTLPDPGSFTFDPAEAPEALVRAYRDSFERVGLPREIQDWLLSGVAHFAALNATHLSSLVRRARADELIVTVREALRLRTRLLNEIGLADVESSGTMLRTEILSTADFAARLDQTQVSMGEEILRLRPLSLAESPLRSLLAWDCATSTYFEKGFDPAFYYFTLTDADGFSFGQITVALGTAWSGWRRVKVAFVDKIQDVPIDDLPLILEALRRVTLAAGYELSLPEKLGDHNGISNDERTRAAVARLPAFAGQTIRYRGFRANRAGRVGKAGFSRAYNWLSVRPLASLDQELDRSIRLRAPDPQVRSTRKVDLSGVFTDVDRLKEGSTEDRIQYVDHADLARQMRVPVPPSVDEQVWTWLRDRGAPSRLRIRAATYLMLKSERIIEDGIFETFLAVFTRTQLRALLHEWSRDRRLRRSLRLAAWFSAPYVRGETILAQEISFPSHLTGAARRALADTLVSPVFSAEIHKLNLRARDALHIDWLRTMVFLETWLNHRPIDSAVRDELRRAALAEVVRLFPAYRNVLPPRDAYAVELFASLFARSELAIDADQLRDFFDLPANLPALPSRAQRVGAFASEYGLAVSVLAGGLAAGTATILGHPNLGTGVVGLGAAAQLAGFVLKDRLENARVQVRELDDYAERFGKARFIGQSLADAVKNASCAADLQATRSDQGSASADAQ